MENNKVVAFGEILLRFTPQNNKPIVEATGFDCFYGGTEANVSIGLASLGDKVSYITVLPDNDLGIAVKNNLVKYGVDIDNIIFQGDVLGSYYLQTGIAGISPSVLYNRKGSEVSKATVDTKFDYDSIFDNCKVFHISGVSFALSDNCRELCFKLIEEAKKRGILVSFDFNYRQKLWSIDEAASVFKKVISLADIVLCAHRDIDAFLNEKTEEDIIKNNGCKYLIVRDRDDKDPKHHKVSACIFMNTESGIKKSKIIEKDFDVTDRVGSGDAFAAGILHAFLKNPEDIDTMLGFGIATFIMKHTIAGDFLAVSEEKALDFYNNLNK